MWKLKRNIAANEFYTVWKKTLLPTKRVFGTVAVNVGHFLWCSKGKALCERLFAFASSAAWNGQPNVDFAYSGKIFADAHACVICVYNLTSALYFAI